MLVKASLTPVLAAIRFSHHGFLLLSLAQHHFFLSHSHLSSYSSWSFLFNFPLTLFPPVFPIFTLSLSHTHTLPHSNTLTLSYPHAPSFPEGPSCFSHLYLAGQRDTQTEEERTERKAWWQKCEEDNQRRERTKWTGEDQRKWESRDERENSELWIISEKRFGPRFTSSIAPSLQEHWAFVSLPVAMVTVGNFTSPPHALLTDS